MDEELLKRFTDCVYFLASPLTCKKGIDCEYRHSEIARLNPRDCWYWLAGSCLNPICAFRHPPLDGLTAATSESAPCIEPVSKTNVPCYFYFNGYCNKVDKCPFLHSLEADVPPVENSVKLTIVNSEVLPLEKNTFAGSDSGLAPTNAHLNIHAAVKATMNTKVQPYEDFQPSALKDVENERDSTQISVSDCEETATIGSNFLFPASHSVQSESYETEEHSSGDRVEGQLDSEDRWESSPGFDVLVDGESENLDCEDDQEFIVELDRERKELNSHFLGYEFESPVDYNSKYHDTEARYEGEMYYPYNDQVIEHIFDDATHMRNAPVYGKAEMFDSILGRKRKLVHVELGYDSCKDEDLREKLSRRRFVGSHSVTGLSRMRESSRLISRRHDGSWWKGMEHRQPHGRLASDVHRRSIESVGNDRNYLNGGRPRGLRRYSQQYHPRKHFKEKRPTQGRSEVSRKLAPRERRSSQRASTFTGPKSLAQIKEEKKRVEGKCDFNGKMGHSRKMVLTDFQGPQPLSEILKKKKKLTGESEVHSSSL
ncbi:zinc finger CCCH domain-containing protein 34-like [Humulus lupulus]|uniref:zinc finger CCCH domain-containing protein 34-like n=1 Tax=Humulus lupulus TaxID=3486 RepID=UPI002B409F17|nr:zinc finger CCCH domain-containing protein 34-like [Humulus lupulus]